MISIIAKLVGSKNSRELKRINKTVQTINSLEDSFKLLTDEQLKQKTTEFKQQLTSGKSLTDILPYAFAAVREASVRTINLRHFDAQLIGGICLHEGNIAEMKTGEGKTLVATLPAYLNTLSNKGVHIVTVNDYLAKRDAEWMTPVYQALGLTVGVLLTHGSPDDKKNAYQADITYGTNNEFGFDYLRDHMVLEKQQITQRGHNFAIIDEVDSILIDEARTPLIISGESEDNTELYRIFNDIIPQLKRQDFREKNFSILNEKTAEEDIGDFMIDEKDKSIQITDLGHENIEKILKEKQLLSLDSSLYDANNMHLMHHAQATLKAHYIFKKNIHYLVKNGEIVIIDESTGRAMVGRRWSEGIHQAIEAKEKVKIQTESQTLAGTSFQNYFRLYDKLAGMTGTADTEAVEFKEIYNLDVLVIPTNKPMVRIDYNDAIYLSKEEKYEAIVKRVKQALTVEQPVLVGTVSVESSEYLSSIFKKHKIKHQVLNAKYHEKEAKIIAQAGYPGKVTIATNMAGRGTDIVLGGNAEYEISNKKNINDAEAKKIREIYKQNNKKVLEVGGLLIIGSERHESRRIDNQLRGRSGRQGDVGETRFYLSIDDDLVRLFTSEKVINFIKNLGFDKGEMIEHNMLNRSIEKAQLKIESRNFDIRKQLLEYDDISNEQRLTIYKHRDDILFAKSIHEDLPEIINNCLFYAIPTFINPNVNISEKDLKKLTEYANKQFYLSELNLIKQFQGVEITIDKLKNHLETQIKNNIKIIEEKFPEEFLFTMEKNLMIRVLDHNWRQHLSNIDFLRQGIHFRGYAQKNPKQEFKREAFEMFEQLIHKIDEDYLLQLLNLANPSVILKTNEEIELEQKLEQEKLKNIKEMHQVINQKQTEQDKKEKSIKTFKRSSLKIGRNELCPCGSGRKFKVCCGKN